jgi:hypothetical protein
LGPGLHVGDYVRAERALAGRVMPHTAWFVSFSVRSAVFQSVIRKQYAARMVREKWKTEGQN